MLDLTPDSFREHRVATVKMTDKPKVIKSLLLLQYALAILAAINPLPHFLMSDA